MPAPGLGNVIAGWEDPPTHPYLSRPSGSQSRLQYRLGYRVSKAAFAFIRAEHDLAAVHAYLNRHRDRLPTERAYNRELERLVLWLVIVGDVVLSSMTVDDAEAYKDILKSPIPLCGSEARAGAAAGGRLPRKVCRPTARRTRYARFARRSRDSPWCGIWPEIRGAR